MIEKIPAQYAYGMKGIEVCEAGDFPLGFSNNHFRKRMTAMYVNPISVVFPKKKNFRNFMGEKFYFLFISIKRYIIVIILPIIRT